MNSLPCHSWTNNHQPKKKYPHSRRATEAASIRQGAIGNGRKAGSRRF